MNPSKPSPQPAGKTTPAPSAPAHPAFAAGGVAHAPAGGWSAGHASPGLSAGPVPGAASGTTAGQAAAVVQPLSPQAQQALVREFQALLQAGMHGLCFSPYGPGQAPGSRVSEAQIRERLQLIRPHAGWVRSFSCTDGHEQTPRLAHALGFKTLVGAWLGTDAQINQREIDGVIAVARAGHADIVAVGNEVLLREDLTEHELLARIEEVRQALPGVPVGYVDAYYLFELHPRITAACDLILTNCYPFWEGCPREQAVAYMQSMYRRTVAVAGGKPVVISETGWPDRGSAFHGAVPSEEGAMRYFIDTQRWAQSEGVDVFYFAAFDEAWKAGPEGDVGARWGLWDAEGQPKFT